MERTGHDFSAAWSGKIKMVLQCAAIALVLAGRAWPGLHLAGIAVDAAATWAAWAAVVATAWSGIEYIIAARSLVR
jgi:phosphatidylglycerophosphate synthase